MKAFPIAFNSGPLTLAQSGSVQADMSLMQTEWSQAPLEIQEISFQVRAAESVSAAPGFGGSIRCRFDVGRYALSNGYVPIWLFGTQIHATPAPNIGSATRIENAIGTTGLEVGGQRAYYNRYLWKLPRPLLVAPGEVVTPQFNRTADGISGNAFIDVTFKGRVLPLETVLPSSRTLPYVSAWVGATGTASQESGELDLVNKYNQPLYVQRMIGRVQTTAGGVLQDSIANGLAAITCQVSYEAETEAIDISRGFIPFYQLFDLDRRALNLGMEIAPRRRFTAAVAGVAANETPMVSIVGRREVPL